MQVDYTKIPAEMRAYGQWCVWKYEDRGSAKPTKVPYNPVTGSLVSVTDSSTYCSYDEAVANAAKYSGIGFILTKYDPYTFIDLDDTEGDQPTLDRQIKVYNEFDSYSERSPSGNGLHIIVKGNVPNGRRRGKIEVYSSERYMTMTGVAFNDKPIMQRQTLLHTLWAEMGGVAEIGLSGGTQPQREDDQTIINRAKQAMNGEKFTELWEGRFQQYYPSQSEADLALFDILAFYTQNREQLIRLFHASALGKRDKAKRTQYLEYMLRKCFDNILPPIDIEGLRQAWDAAKAEEKQKEIISGPLTAAMKSLRDLWHPVEITPPPGLVGSIAQFVYDQAPRPFPEMAICAALGLMSGITGRAYNISGTGLNLYILLLAATGTGKEAMATGIEKIIRSIVAKGTTSARQFRGPSEIASGQGLLKYLSNHNPCFLSLVGEFGLKMKQLSDPRASSAEVMLKRVLLDLYNKSGFNSALDGSAYAQKENNVEPILRPAFSLLGESTPETFYDALDTGLISDGLLPRFMTIEYNGERAVLNENAESVVPSAHLIDQLAALCHHSNELQNKNMVIHVELSKEAKEFSKELDHKTTAVINATETDALRHLWNRAHIKTLRTAANIAVGMNPYNPQVSIETLQWAYNIVSIDVLAMVARFERGEVGKGGAEDKQPTLMLNICTEYMDYDPEKLTNYEATPKMHKDGVIPWAFISKRLLGNKIFKQDRLGPTNALKRTLGVLIDSGDLREVPKQELFQRYEFTGKAFVISALAKAKAKM